MCVHLIICNLALWKVLSINLFWIKIDGPKGRIILKAEGKLNKTVNYFIAFSFFFRRRGGDIVKYFTWEIWVCMFLNTFRSRPSYLCTSYSLALSVFDRVIHIVFKQHADQTIFCLKNEKMWEVFLSLFFIQCNFCWDLKILW